MPRIDRAPSFPFYPADWLADTAVSLMEPAAAGGHMHLMAHAWESSLGTGVLRLDDDELAKLSRLGPDWPAYRDQVLRAWRVDEVAGTITQQRQVEERRAQKRRRARAAEGGKATQKLLQDRRNTSTAGADEQLFSTPIAGTPSSSSSSSSSNNPSLRAARAEWREAFDLFWKAYPRKTGKAPALASWEKRCPKTVEECQPMFDWIDAGLAACIAGEWKDREDRFVPHASTWLNQRRWEDVPRPEIEQQDEP